MNDLHPDGQHDRQAGAGARADLPGTVASLYYAWNRTPPQIAERRALYTTHTLCGTYTLLYIDQRWLALQVTTRHIRCTV